MCANADSSGFSGVPATAVLVLSGILTEFFSLKLVYLAFAPVPAFNADRGRFFRKSR